MAARDVQHPAQRPPSGDATIATTSATASLPRVWRDRPVWPLAAESQRKFMLEGGNQKQL